MRFKLLERIHSLQQPKAPKSNHLRAGSIKSENSRGTKASTGKASEMTFVERDSEMRRMKLMKEIAIFEAEEKAINDALIDERQEIEVKPELVKLDPLVPPFIPNLPPYQTQETTETKPKVTPTYPQDNTSNLPPPPTVPLGMQQRVPLLNKESVQPILSQCFRCQPQFIQTLTVLVTKDLPEKQAH